MKLGGLELEEGGDIWLLYVGALQVVSMILIFVRKIRVGLRKGWMRVSDGLVCAAVTSI